MQDDKYQEPPAPKGGKEPPASKAAKEPLATAVPTGSGYNATTTGVGLESSAGYVKHVQVSFGPKTGPFTPDEDLWREIRNRTNAISFGAYSQFIDSLLSDPIPASTAFNNFDGLDGTDGPRVPSTRSDAGQKLQAGLRTRLFGPDAYRLVQFATECFLMTRACTNSPDFANSPYLVRLGQEGALPYLNLIRERLAEIPVGDAGKLSLGSSKGYAISNSRLFEPCFLELIWSYWHEQGMLVQTINAIAIRYQNIRMGEGRDPLGSFELDPLRPLNNLLWGYLQEEHRRLSVLRRAYEYDHHYGLRIYGKAVPELRPADSRAKFMAAFHELLHQAHIFYKDDDIATVQADPFPVLNALRELHFVLAEAMSNQFGDMPSQARGEMLIQQWLLARPEMREFLRGRVSVPYPEPWMDCVDTMKTLQGWSDVPVLYFNELAVTGEQLLLSVRYADWATQTPTSTDSAANWARFHRSLVQRYQYAYRMLTNIDLTVDRVEVQSARVRDGQPPIRMRGHGAHHATASARMLDEDGADLLPSPNQRALPGAGADRVPARNPDRVRRI